MRTPQQINQVNRRTVYETSVTLCLTKLNFDSTVQEDYLQATNAQPDLMHFLQHVLGTLCKNRLTKPWVRERKDMNRPILNKSSQLYQYVIEDRTFFSQNTETYINPKMKEDNNLETVYYPKRVCRVTL